MKDLITSETECFNKSEHFDIQYNNPLNDR